MAGVVPEKIPLARGFRRVRHEHALLGNTAGDGVSLPVEQDEEGQKDTAQAGQPLPSCAACSNARSGRGGSSSHLTWQTGSERSALAPNHQQAH